MSHVPWEEINNLRRFSSAGWKARLTNGISSAPGPLPHDVGDVVLNRLYRVNKGDRARTLARKLQDAFVDKDEVIKMLIVSSIAQQPMLLVGEPGTAKSALVTRMCEGLGIRRVGEAMDGPAPEEVSTAPGRVHDPDFFLYQLHAFTEPDEVLGPVNLRALRDEEVFRRIRKGCITDASVVFMDEDFKGNSAILNALLTIINDRRVYECGASVAARTRVIFGATNNVPSPRQLEDLLAFYERWTIRVKSNMIPRTRDSLEDGRLAGLLAKGTLAEVKAMRGGYDPEKTASEPVSCVNDLIVGNLLLAESFFKGGGFLMHPNMKSFIRDYMSVVSSLTQDKACRIDDRKFIKIFVVCCAHAVLMRRGGEPTREDIQAVLPHVWDHPDHEEKLKDTVASMVHDLPAR